MVSHYIKFRNGIFEITLTKTNFFVQPGNIFVRMDLELSLHMLQNKSFPLAVFTLKWILAQKVKQQQ